MEIAISYPLSKVTTIGTGGPAAAYARPRSLAELEEAFAWAAERGLDVVVMGLGSNLLAADDGVEALVVRLDGELSAAEVDGQLFAPAAGRRTPCASTARDRPGWAASSSRVRSRALRAEASG